MPALTTLLQSRTLWSNAVGLGALIVSGFGLNSAGVDQNQLTDSLTQIVAGVSFLSSSLFHIVSQKPST